MEKATIIIPCYNSEDTIERAVRSALDQTLPVRVIVADDCSTDRSFELLNTMAAREPRLTVIRLERNGGPSAARNAALKLVETDWVAGLDSDDYLLPRRMELLVAHAEASGCDFVADDLIRVQPGEGPEKGLRVWRDEPFGVAEFDVASFVKQNMTKYAGFRQEIGYLKPLMRVAFLRETGLHYNEALRLSEDYEIYVRSYIAGARWQVIDPCGYIAVDRPGSLSNAIDTRALESLRAADALLMRTPGVPAAGRRAIAEHRHHVTVDLAWMNLISSVKARKLAGALRTFWYSPSVSGKLALRIAKHFLKIPLYPDDPEAGRPRFGESGTMSLT